jgi:peptidoglycan/LPS O-acetylase OafA/YrhL
MYLLQIVCVSAVILVSEPSKWALLKSWLFDLLTFRALVLDWFGYGVGVLWTLYVEFWFYVTFPFVMMALIALPFAVGKTVKLTVGFSIIALAVFVVRTAGHAAPQILFYDHFLLGALAAIFARSTRIQVFSKPATVIWGVLIIVIALSIPYPGGRNTAWFLQSLMAAFGTVVVILSTAARPPLYRFPHVVFIGHISYSMYLVHAVLLDVMPNLPRETISGLILYLAMVVAISYLTFRYLEQPAIHFIHERIKFSRGTALSPTGSAA